MRGATLNVDTQSVYAQDRWAINRHLTADLGVRYERVRSEATGGIVGVDTDTLVPRLAAAYDVSGDGGMILHATYGHYAGRYNEAQIGVNSNVGNPDEAVSLYAGPAGQGRGFAPGFDPTGWAGVFGPAGLPPEVVTTLGTALEKFAKDPDMNRQLSAGGTQPAWVGPNDMPAHLAADIVRWTQLAKDSGIQPE